MNAMRPMATLAMALLMLGMSGCTEKDDPEALSITLTDVGAGHDGMSGRPDGMSRQTEETVRLLGATPTQFSVGTTCKVRFSPGNLQYHAGTGSWRFAEQQYLTAEVGSGVVDLFGWGTSGWNSGAQAIAPQSTEGGDSCYWPGNNPLASLTGDYENADWALYNAIANGGGKSRLWRVLSGAEWQYLLGNSNERRNKWGLATIEGGHRGVLILPDEWEAPVGFVFTPGADGWETNVYSAEQWRLIDRAGAVFLPAAGFRDGEEVRSVGLTGNYWSTSVVDSVAAADLFFRGRQLNAADLDLKHYGFSVRPVLE